MTTPTPLGAAVLKGDVDEARRLLATGADPKEHTTGIPMIWGVYFERTAPLLHLAVLSGNAAMVKLLLSHGVDVEERPRLTQHYQTHDDTYEVDGSSALLIAANHGFLVIADALMEAGAKPDTETGQALARAKQRAP